MKKMTTIFLSVSVLAACGGNSDNDVEEVIEEVIESSSESTLLKSSYFSTTNLIGDFELVDCTLSDGSSSECYTFSYANTPEAWGPLCPETEDDTGGVGFYENTSPELNVLDSDLWALFEADGYDIIDEDGNVNVVVPTGGPGSVMVSDDDTASADLNGSCLDADLIEDLVTTYTIPAYPVTLDTARELDRIEYAGVSIDGFPMAGEPPATVIGDQAAIPALDPCGGHPQPDGPFHWHIIPQEANNVLAAAGISKVSCVNITQTSTTVIGIANDGFPIYGSLDSDSSQPNDLDNCRGHIGNTDDYLAEDYPDGVYHYHISDSDAPNNLTCLMGASVTSAEFADYEY